MRAADTVGEVPRDRAGRTARGSHGRRPALRPRYTRRRAVAASSLRSCAAGLSGEAGESTCLGAKPEPVNARLKHELKGVCHPELGTCMSDMSYFCGPVTGRRA